MSSFLRLGLALTELGCAGLAVARAETAPGNPLPAEPPAWRVEAVRSRVAVIEEKDRTLLRVTCPAGLGSLTIARGDGRWPRRVTLRLEYGPGKPFRDLEGFTVEAGKERLEGRFTPGRAETGDGTPPTSPLRFRRTDEGVDVELPMDRIADSKAVTIWWADYWRQ